MVFSENRFPTPDQVGAGFFGIMLQNSNNLRSRIHAPQYRLKQRKAFTPLGGHKPLLSTSEDN
jgi:hypothetical protein